MMATTPMTAHYPAGYAVAMFWMWSPAWAGVVEQTDARIIEIAEHWPTHTQTVVLGTSTEGRPLLALEIPARAPCAQVLILGGIHPIEWLGTEASLVIAEAFGATPSPSVSLTVVPQINPDGRALVEADQQKRKRKTRRGNAQGVDLNRDFPQAPNGIPTQPETQALDALWGQGFDAMLSLHSYGDVLLIPWTGQREPIPDEEKMLAVGRAMVPRHTRVAPFRKWRRLSSVQGTELDRAYGKYGTWSYVLELGRGPGLRPNAWRSSFRAHNPKDSAAWIDLAKAAALSLVAQVEAGLVPSDCAPP